MTALELLLPFLPDATVRPNGSVGFTCPTHQDRTAFARLKKDGNVMLGCTSGCLQEEIRAKLEITSDQLIQQSPPEPEATAPEPEAAREPPRSTRTQTHSTVYPQGSATHQTDILRRVPPQNIDAEESVLGAILLENGVLGPVQNVIKAEDWYRESHRMIYSACVSLGEAQIPIDAITLSSLLKQRHQLEQIGGPAYLADLAVRVPTASTAVHYARLVRDAAVKRRIAAASTEIATMAYNGVSADGLVGEAERILTPLMEQGNTSGAITVYEGDSFFLETQHVENTSWLWEDIFPTVGLVGIFGDPEAGKSTLCRTIAMAISRGDELFGRQTTASIVLYLDLAGELLSHRRSLAKMGWTSGNFKFVSDTSLLDNDRGGRRIEQVIKQCGARLVVVDMMADLLRFKDMNEYASAKTAMRELRLISEHTGCLLLALHHTPKNMPPEGDPLKAALGSQAIVGAFDLRIAVRRRATNVSTMQMTAGKIGGRPILEEHNLIRDLDTDWITLGQRWGDSRAALFLDKVVQFMNDADGAMTSFEVAEEMGVPPSWIRGSLNLAVKQNMLGRDGTGKKGSPFRYQKLYHPPGSQEDSDA